MSKYKLSKRSLSKLEGVNEPLVATVKRAIELTKVDFGVICGLRSQEEQKALVAKGASQTMHSRHLTGNAVDLMAYIDGRGCWELNVYDEIADAMKAAAMETGAKIRWGCAWHIDSLVDHSGTMEAAMNLYIDLRRTAGRRPFLDGPHFELR
tara:strand:- start:501 stop:956 length:456 start_codon:yes stop_codon:yes gene_type:complete